MLVAAGVSPATSLLVVATARAVDTVRRYDADGRPLGTVDGLGDVVAVAGLTRRPRHRPRRSSSSTRSPRRRRVWRVGAGDRPRAWSAPPAGDGVVPTLVGQPGHVPVARRHVDRAVPDPPRRRRRRARTCRRSSTATAASPSPRRRCGRRRSPPGARPAGCTPSPGCAAGSRRARRGTTPAGGRNKQNVFDDFHAAADWLVGDGPRRPRPPGRPRTVERRPARRRRPDPAPRPVPGRVVRRAAARHDPLPAVPHRPAVDRASTATPTSPRSSPGCTPTRRTTTSSTARATRRRCSRRPRATPASTRCTPARWRRCCRPRRRARTSGRSCCSRRAAPATASASRSPSGPTSWPTG